MEHKLLNEEELEWSTVVANNTMNRERKATGINSYEKELKLNPIEFLEKRNNNVQWVDLCCGSGNALIQCANYFQDKALKGNLLIQGIDLVNFFSPALKPDFLELIQMNVNRWKPKNKSDLITIVHGLHYIGDKINIINNCLMNLKKDGYFIGSLDLENIKIKGIKNPKRTVRKILKENGIDFNGKTKLLSATGKHQLQHNLKYLGADDNTGPNYTGQPVVDSYYEII